MAVDRFQLSGLVRPLDLAHVVLDRIQISAYFRGAQATNAGLSGIEIDQHPATRFFLIDRSRVRDAPIDLHRTGRRGQDEDG